MAPRPHEKGWAKECTSVPLRQSAVLCIITIACAESFHCFTNIHNRSRTLANIETVLLGQKSEISQYRAFDWCPGTARDQPKTTTTTDEADQRLNYARVPSSETRRMYDNIWLKRVWIPFWVIQLIVTLVLLASIALGFAVLRDNKSDIADDVSDAGYNNDDFNSAWSAVR